MHVISIASAFSFRAWDVGWGVQRSTYCEVAGLTLASSELLADLVREIMFSAAGEGRFPDGFFLELDRHGEGSVEDDGQVSGG